MSNDMRTKQDGYYLGPWAVQRLNERHGWFEFADAQSHVSRAFANNAIHEFIESGKEAQRVEDETGLTPKELAKMVKQLEASNAELLMALQTCLAFIEDAHIVEGQWHWEPVQTARAAIAKALGEQA